MKSNKIFRNAHDEDLYRSFDQLDGSHPWADQVPEGSILYPARVLAGGKVSYFNFELAIEMGLIPKDHPREMNKDLEAKLLSTFNLRIVNEYDDKHGITYDPKTMKPGKYMATRYLQLQHVDKTGRTSGDGRCIWNGFTVGKGKAWDVSSRGTGVTALAPGVVLAGEPLKSGNRDHGYGCGMADLDELFGAAILAEIFHRNGIPTERMLAVIDNGRGIGIGVRAGQNLLRPAHMFLFLKQGRLEPLKRSLDYFIDRQSANKTWKAAAGAKDRYAKLLGHVTASFAKFAATLDRDYIFAWLDWDGDNVLADAGIIDYGSIRQFGLRHDQYRYDDVERWSTNLNEQRQKAREMVQTFVQLVDYVETGVRKPVGTFKKSEWLAEFDRQFETQILERFLYQIGFPEPQRRLLMNKHRREVESLFAVHSEFERTKTHKKIRRVADGVHRPAIYNMRVALAHMADYLDGLPYEMIELVESREFLSWIISSQAAGRDRRLGRRLRRQMALWQQRYLRLVRKVTTPATWDKTTAKMNSRATQINHEARITGNALIHIVDDILKFRRRGLTEAQLQKAIEELIQAQTLNPDSGVETTSVDGSSHPILRSFLTVVHGFREDI